MNIITRILLYDACYIVGFLLLLLNTLLTCIIYKTGRLRAVIYSFVTFLFGLAGAKLIAIVYNALWSLKDLAPGIKVDMVGAVIFTSPLILAAVYAEKGILRIIEKRKATQGKETEGRSGNINFRDTLDMMIPGSFLTFAAIKLGCQIRGCCYGVKCSWGVHSVYINADVFPIQIFECATLLLILLICFHIKQTRFFRRGMAGPLTAGMYGVARFFWEFLRYYTPEYRYFFAGLTLWQILCLLIILVASIWTYILCKTQPSEPLPKRKLFAIPTEQTLKKQNNTKKKNAQSGKKKGAAKNGKSRK